ncbi:hypothetical protein V6N12_067397 [Hibiscus sabdariffa]|uniref:Reverse transcriptase zinc-binding domain-containing protein n=1 Tax=Hibiscus sabdariffa TaxID=183260 RepID=A0ABR2BE70_9ROSI
MPPLKAPLPRAAYAFFVFLLVTAVVSLFRSAAALVDLATAAKSALETLNHARSSRFFVGVDSTGPSISDHGNMFSRLFCFWPSSFQVLGLRRLGLGPDMVGCCVGKDRQFSVSLTYTARCGPTVPVYDGLWKQINIFWRLQRVETFLWLICCNRVMINAERVRHHFSIDASCLICGFRDETISHLFWTCLVAIVVWKYVVKLSKHEEFLDMDISEWVMLNLSDLKEVCNLRCYLAMCELLDHMTRLTSSRDFEITILRVPFYLLPAILAAFLSAPRPNLTIHYRNRTKPWIRSGF